jgi:phage terminase large subunit-like protein
MNWLHERFGGVEGRTLVEVEDDDPFLDFKRTDALVVTLKTEENLPNLDPGYVDEMRRALSPEEFALFMEAQWVRLDSAEKFVNIVWWDNCKEELPALTRSEPMVLGVDASKGGKTSLPDTFAVVGVTRHPHRPNDFAVRYCGVWEPEPGELMDYHPIVEEMKRLCREFSVIEIAYDPYQLHSIMMDFRREGIVPVREFGQAGPRLKADKGLQDLIVGRRISHTGNPLLRRAIDNANIQKHGRGEGIRLIKRSPSAKIDAAVALSEAASRSAYYNL